MAAGNALGVYVLQNTSATTCRLFGYPGLQMLDSNHRPVPTTVMPSVTSSALVTVLFSKTCR